MQITNDNIVIRWNTALLQAVRGTSSKPPVVARAIAMVHTAMYDAWAHFDDVAGAVHSQIRRVPTQERSEKNAVKAISYAAFRVLYDLFPSQIIIFEGLMNAYGYDLQATGRYDKQTPAHLTPEQIGNTVAYNLLVARRQDGSNQVGNYEDLSKDYNPVNDPEPAAVRDINHWQQLTNKKTGVVQQFLYPHWGWVVPFCFDPGRNLQEVKPPLRYPRAQVIRPDEDEELVTAQEKSEATEFEKNCKQIVDLSAGLDDTTKTIVEYWADGPDSETPPGHWCMLARIISLRDNLDLTENIKMFFALGNALFDASIACWRLKVEHDFCRPVTAIHTLYEGEERVFWGGPYQGNVCKPADEAWRPYLPTPAFAEFPSGHSTFSAAAATILRLFTGSNYFGHEVVIGAGSSKIEPGFTPARDVVLEWKSFNEASRQAGYSRMQGGIHFKEANEEGQKLGNKLAGLVWDKVRQYWSGALNTDTNEEDC